MIEELDIDSFISQECEVDEIEDIMRHDIFHSTLDWQTKEELEEAAVLAYLALKEIEDE